MTTYTELPAPRTARRVWRHLQARRPAVPLAKLWKNPNCWGKARVAGNMWGWWVCEYQDGKIDYMAPGEIG